MATSARKLTPMTQPLAARPSIPEQTFVGPAERFHHDCLDEIAAQSADPELLGLSQAWLRAAHAHRYSYHFSCMGRPIIQYPQDVVALQELIWRIRPRLIIETGIAHGGSLMLSASMLAMLDYCDAVEQGTTLDPRDPDGRRVIGVDIDIRPHNRAAIEAHPLAHRIMMMEGSSIAPETIERVRSIAANRGPVMVILDSNHTHDHVLAELEAYAPLTTPGSYCCVFDTLIEDLDGVTWPGRAWSKGNNPRTAVRAYLQSLDIAPRSAADSGPLKFRVDEHITQRLLITVAAGGFLQRI
jgi:cephalosporin hydroxylase